MSLPFRFGFCLLAAIGVAALSQCGGTSIVPRPERDAGSLPGDPPGDASVDGGMPLLDTGADASFRDAAAD